MATAMDTPYGNAQKLAHTLLVELLAYQFASPVRWIETQDVLLHPDSASKIVEIGPGPILTGMAKRTIASKYAAQDSTNLYEREILSISKDKSALYYEADGEEEEEVTAAPAVDKISSQPILAAPAPAPVVAPVVAPVAAPAQASAEVADEPAANLDIIRALIAQKVKVKFGDVPLSCSVKDMAKGKSTLQNELIGDFGGEFDALPESPEDIAIEDLGSMIKPTTSLGKVSSALISKMMMSKMPSNFNNAAARAYLKSRWGFGPGRQDATLLDALTEEPSARLGDDEARAFMDAAVKRYAGRSGVSLATATSSAGGSSSSSAAVSADALAALSQVQNQYLGAQLELLSKHLGQDVNGQEEALEAVREDILELTSQLDLWQSEHGEAYGEGIKSTFDKLKIRTYDSWWNWARVEALAIYHQLARQRSGRLDGAVLQRCYTLANQATPALIKMMEGYARVRIGGASAPAKAWSTVLEICKEGATKDALFLQTGKPTAPSTKIEMTGKVVFQEVPREGEASLVEYIENVMNIVLAPMLQEKIAAAAAAKPDLAQGVAKRFQDSHTSSAMSFAIGLSRGPDTPPGTDGMNSPFEHMMSVNGEDSSSVSQSTSPQQERAEPPVMIKQRDGAGWAYDVNSTVSFLNALNRSTTTGTTFKGTYALITGAGPGSIAGDLLTGLLQGGANVIVTTSRSNPRAFAAFQDKYVKNGGRGSQLIVAPFNQGSKKDVESLVEYIYGTLKWDLDFFIPFAAVPEGGNDLTNIDSRSEFAHRLMLTNTLRMMGGIMSKKQTLGLDTNPTQVLLPLSPNHGTFGKDGLYSESKIALETAFNKWESESWQSYLSLTGAIIGWTRGTGLMNANNQIAEAIEMEGVRTFSAMEMAFHLMGLLAPALRKMATESPILADLGGGLMSLPKLGDRTIEARLNIMSESDLKKSIYKESQLDKATLATSAKVERSIVEPRANFDIGFPTTLSYSEIISSVNQDLQGMVDLEGVVVVTGFSEVGPWGNSRTRWDMEVKGAFTLEGCIEMAWIMGLIKNFSGPIDGKPYTGWVDAVSGAPVTDKDIFQYEDAIKAHAGIRMMEPELLEGYDPLKRKYLQEISVAEDLAPFEASEVTARSFKLQHGEHCSIREMGPDQFQVRILKGAMIMVPKAQAMTRRVAALLPTGWDPVRYGIPKEIVDNVDPVALYALVCVADALIQAGVTDPYEVYKHIHISEMANCIGTGAGGQAAFKKIYVKRFLEEDVAGDILQESFANTPAAWVNMLLMSSTGPIRTGVGACATSIEALDTGYETIVTGKAKMCLVGATDDINQEMANEFGSMNATSNSLDELAKGRAPHEMSRPTTTTRAGFMESHGAGIQVLMNAKLALEMGVPIYGIIAFANTASDKIGRSVPAPGQGVLGSAREAQGQYSSPLLDLSYRKSELATALNHIESWKTESEANLKAQVGTITDDRIKHLQRHIDQEVARRTRGARGQWGIDFWKNNSEISPIRGSLAAWGLTIDDVSLVSFHGTSTTANDTNECGVINKQMNHLGRTPGNPVLAICQKYLTGHPKGPAGAWMLNGALQAMNTGIIPGNRNADNVDYHFEDFEHVVLPNRAIQTDDIKAFSVTSFGFGQKGAQVIGVNPRYLYATLDRATYNDYRVKVTARKARAQERLHDSLATNSFFRVKDHPPYDPARESEVLLNPTLRATDDGEGSFSFTVDAPITKVIQALPTPKMIAARKASIARPQLKLEPVLPEAQKVQNMTAELLSGKPQSIGVDMTVINTLPIENALFLTRNFTAAEQSRALASARGQAAACAGMWCAKEAVFKCLDIPGRGAGAPLKDIEVCHDANGKPAVSFHGEVAKEVGADMAAKIHLSISYTEEQVIAVAVKDLA